MVFRINFYREDSLYQGEASAEPEVMTEQEEKRFRIIMEGH